MNPAIVDGPDLDFGSADEHEECVKFAEVYSQFIKDHYLFVNAVEESAPLPDWVSQDIKLNGRLNCTDTQIRNALEILHERGEVVTFDSLRPLLTPREDAVLKVQYAYSADVQLVLNECHAIYGREPTQGTGIVNLMYQVAEKEVEVTYIKRDNERLLEQYRVRKNQVAYEQAQAEKERARANTLQVLHSRLTKTLKELKEECEINKCLEENLVVWQKRVETLNGQVSNLSEDKEKLHRRLTKTLKELKEECEINKCLEENLVVWQKRVETLNGQVSNLSEDKEKLCSLLKKTLKDLQEERGMNKNKEKLRSLLKKTLKDLQEEREMNKNKEKENQELHQQLRDLMFHLEAPQKLASTTAVSQEEIQEGHVVVGATGSTPSPSHKRGRKKDR